MFIVHSFMMSLVPVLKQDDDLHRYRIFFYYLTALLFSESYVRFMSCHVTETMLYGMHTVYYKGSGETAHMCKLV